MEIGGNGGKFEKEELKRREKDEKVWNGGIIGLSQ